VALSRVRSLSDVHLIDYHESRITADSRVKSFYEKVLIDITYLTYIANVFLYEYNSNVV